MNTIVDSLHDDFRTLLAYLDEKKEVSLRSVADANLRKTLLIAAASSFERCLTEIVVEYAKEATSENHVLVWLVKNKAVRGQYHQWFDWNKKNANRFFSLFGKAFKKYAETTVKDNEDLRSSIHAFLEIGRLRNQLVHQDFGSFTLEKTSQEIYDLYASAKKFVEWFPHTIRQFTEEAVRTD